MLAASVVWGSVPTWALFLLGIFAAWRLSRGGAGSAVSELSKANEVLTKRNHELGGEVRDLKIECAKLEAKTDVTLALEPVVQRLSDTIGEHESRALQALTDHEGRAIERHQAQLDASGKQLVVLEMIAGRLGPDNGNGHQVAA